MAHEFKPGDIVVYVGDDEDYPKERVIGEEEWLTVRSGSDDTFFEQEKVYTVSVEDGTFLGKCYPKNFEMVKPFREVLFKEAL